MNVFLANIGNRDIALDIGGGWFLTFSKGRDGADLANYLGCKEGTRNLARYILDNLEKYRQALRLPILGPSLRLVFGKVQRLDILVLFATDQPPSIGPHREWDTIESAKLIQALLPTQTTGSVGTILIEPVSFNPSEHDQAFQYIGSVLDRQIPPDVENLFASIKGGIPAMNAALRERVVHRFGSRAWLIETDEPPEDQRWEGKEGNTRILSSWPFRRDAVNRLIRELLDSENYAAALSILASEGITDPFVLKVLEHAQKRQNLDFKGAAEALSGLGRLAEKWLKSAQIAQEDPFQRLGEVYQTTLSSLHRGDYVGFLTRLEAFLDNARRSACELLLGVKIRGSSVSEEILKKAKVKVLEKLKRRVPSKTRHWETGRKLYAELLEIAASATGKEHLIGTLDAQLKQLKRLERLRHKVLHELAPISKEQLEQCYGSNIAKIKDNLSTILAVMQNLNPRQSEALTKNVFLDIKTEVLQRLERI